MYIASLGSGSRGNATVVRSAGTTVLVDNGFPYRELCRRLERLDLSPGDLDAVLVTHEHSDHCAGVAALARATGAPVFLSHGTLASGRVDAGDRVRPFDAGAAFTIGKLEVQAVPVPHDAREPCQFVFEDGRSRLGVLTDLGSASAHVERAFSACDTLVLEFNHDPALLAAGPYPPSVKRRVGGAWGHLSNVQAAALLQSLDHGGLRRVVLAHLSEQNNRRELALAALSEACPQFTGELLVADQETGFGWLPVAAPSDASAAA